MPRRFRPGLTARCFRALGEPTRLRMLGLLARRERSVGELARDLGLAQPLVSHHLKLLLNAGFVLVRRDGRRHCYILAPDRLARCVRALEAGRCIPDCSTRAGRA